MVCNLIWFLDETEGSWLPNGKCAGVVWVSGLARSLCCVQRAVIGWCILQKMELIDRFTSPFLAQHRKLVEKVIHEKRGHRTFKIVKSRQSYSNVHPRYCCSFYCLARARCMTWRVNLRAQYECRETISMNVLTS